MSKMIMKKAKTSPSAIKIRDGFRHALAIDDTGEKLAMGSTTGNVWVSEDQGDTWAIISSTLPQVYAVRWY